MWSQDSLAEPNNKESQHGLLARRMLDLACFAGALMTCAQEVPLGKDIKGQDLLRHSRQIGSSRTEFTRKGELAIWSSVGRMSVCNELRSDWFIEWDTTHPVKEDSSFLSGQSNPLAIKQFVS